MSHTTGTLPPDEVHDVVMTSAEVDEAMTVVNDTLAAARQRQTDDVIAAMLGKLEADAIPGKHDVAFDCDGRDYDLVWDRARAGSIDATLWDETDEDPVQVATLRFTVQVIA